MPDEPQRESDDEFNGRLFTHGEPPPIPLLKEIQERFERVLRSDEPPGDQLLWHYTTAVGVKGIVEDKAIRATHYRYTNDRSEMLAGEEAIARIAARMANEGTPDHRRIFRVFAAHYPHLKLSEQGHPFLASFCCDGGDSLSQWRAYGKEGAGYSLGFALEPPAPPPNDGSEEVYRTLLFTKVRYGDIDSDGDFSSALADVAAIWIDYKDRVPGLGAIVMPWLIQQAEVLTPRFKSEHFHDEKEWRAVVLSGIDDPRRQTCIIPRGLVPYINVPFSEFSRARQMPLREVVVGPGPDQAERELAVLMLLGANGLDDVDVRCSPIPYRG